MSPLPDPIYFIFIQFTAKFGQIIVWRNPFLPTPPPPPSPSVKSWIRCSNRLWHIKHSQNNKLTVNPFQRWAESPSNAILTSYWNEFSTKQGKSSVYLDILIVVSLYDKWEKYSFPYLNNTCDKKAKIKSHNVTIYLCQAVLTLAMDQSFNPFTVPEENDTPRDCGSKSQWRISSGSRGGGPRGPWPPRPCENRS